MRETAPQVHLIVRPSFDWMAARVYLQDIGAYEYIERKDEEYFRSDRLLADGEDLIEFAGRACYRSWEPGINKNVRRVRQGRDAYIRNILNQAHGSVLEHANYTFILANVSRVFTHELVRHRAGMAYSQESLRFVRLDDIGFWFPEWVDDDDDLRNELTVFIENAERLQVKMAERFNLDDPDTPFSEKKAKTSFMRRFAPEGLSTTIIATGNIRAWRNIIAQRTDPHAEEEIRLLFKAVYNLLNAEVPACFSDSTVVEGTGQVVFANAKI